MAKKTIQRFLPDPNKIRHHKSLKIFGKLLQDANLWHLNRRSARGAFAVGLFFAFIPVPFQMVLAAATNSFSLPAGTNTESGATQVCAALRYLENNSRLAALVME